MESWQVFWNIESDVRDTNWSVAEHPVYLGFRWPYEELTLVFLQHAYLSNVGLLIHLRVNDESVQNLEVANEVLSRLPRELLKEWATFLHVAVVL